MSKKIYKYCDLGKAISHKDKEFYQALDDFCMLSLLRPMKGGGVTFIFPEDKAYRKKIINMFYSKEPEKAVKIIKSLILLGCYKKPADFQNGTVVNKLNQIIEISSVSGNDVVIKNGPTISIDDDFSPMDYRSSNMSMAKMKGSKEIPEGSPAPPRHSDSFRNTYSTDDNDEDSPKTKRKGKTGGGFFNFCDCSCSSTHKSAIQDKVSSIYKLPGERDKKSNIYVKKVYLQLKIIMTEAPDLVSSKKILNYLGNEEFSDSYLLDMITPEELLCKLWNCLGADESGIPQSLENKQNLYAEYMNIKNQIIGQNPQIEQILQKNINEQKNILKKVRSPVEIRSALIDSYASKELLGRDLFIVYTNVMKEMWMAEPDYAQSMFECFSYAAKNIYTSCVDMVNQQLNPWKDLTLAGNLLKSDVYKYQPYVMLNAADNIYIKIGYASKSYIPEPLSLELYSLITIMYNLQNKMVGGGPQEEILSKYL